VLTGIKCSVGLFSAAPPERPTAPKPGHHQQLPAAAFELPPDAVLGMPSSLVQPSAAGMPQMPSSEAPKLKDFLPFMKPGSFGPRAQAGSRVPTVSNDCAPGSAGSLPASVSASPVHLPQASVSFPPSPQRQPPVSLPTSNGHAEMPWSAGTGFVHSDAGYPIAEMLLSPTAPPGAPRSASPALQPPLTIAHPGGPAESQQQQPFRPVNMPYSVPQNYSQASVDVSSTVAGIGVQPTSSHTDTPVHRGHSSNSQRDMQVTGQPPVVSNPVYSGHSLSQPGIAAAGVYTQQALPSNISSFQNQVTGRPSLVSNAAVVPTAQHSGLPHTIVASMGVPPVSAGFSQSYPGGNVAANNLQQPNVPVAVSDIRDQQVNNSNNTPRESSLVGGTQLSNIEVSKPYYYQAPMVLPPPSTAGQFPYLSKPGHVRPPSYEVVIQQYPPPAQPMHQPAQPSFSRPLSNVHPPGITPPAQTSYPVHPEMSYGNVRPGNLPTGNQQSYPQHPIASQPQQQPVSHQVTSASQSPFVPGQHPVMPMSAGFVEQQPQHVSHDQPRYPVVTASQTVPGLPMPSQQFPDASSHAPNQAPSHAQYPIAHPQPRYPAVPSTQYPGTQPYPAGMQQLPYRQPPASQMQPMHPSAGQTQPVAASQHQYQPRPGQPSRPEVHHTAGYPPGGSPQMRYPDANQAYNQPTSAYSQPTAVISHPQQQVRHPSSAMPQQSLYHPGSSQPPVANQSAFNVSTAQAPFSSQHPPSAGTSYAHSMNGAPGEMQALVDIPVCLPSPLQPSRVTTAEVSKNVDSLRDIDLSGKTASSTGDAQPKQRDSSVKPSGEDLAEGKDVTAAEYSCVKVDEKSDDHLHHSDRQSSHASRDVYADSDTMTRFVAEVEKFQKHVDSLVKPTLGGYFPLDKEWKVSFLLCMYL